MANYNVGTAKGVIDIDYNGQGNVDKAKEDIEGLGESGQKVDKSLNTVGKGAGIAGAAIAAGLGIAVKSAADFEARLSGIQAVSGATASEMDMMRDKALQLGADTAFSAAESAMAMEELVKAGLTIPDVMNGAADATVALAAAGSVELPLAAEIAANAMNQFGLSAEEMPNVADKIAGAANASAIEVTDFAQSISQAGAVANLVGLSFDDTALAITAMGNAGIKGSDAGTSLKTFLMNLQPQTQKQIDLFKELGIVLEDGTNQFYDANGQVKSMSEIAGVLETSLAGMTDAQKQAALEVMFGSDAIRAAAVIAESGSAGMDGLAESMSKVSAADVAATRMDNLSGSIEEMMGSVETMAIQLGTILIPIIRDFVDNLKDMVNWFGELSPGTQEFIVKAAAIAAGLLLALGAFVKIVSMIKTTVAAFKVLGTAMQVGKLFGPLITGLKAAGAAFKAFSLTLLTNPIFLIIAAIVALVAGLVLLYKKNETFRNFVNAAWAKIKEVIGAVVDWLVGTAWPFIQQVWESIKSGAQSLWQNIVSIWNGIKDAISTALNAIKTVFSTIWSAIVAVVTTYINIVKTIITTYINAILAIWRGIWSIFGPIIMAVWDLIKTIVQVGIHFIKTIITTVLGAIKAYWTAVWNAIKAVATAVWNGIKIIVTTVVNAIKTVVTTVFNAVKSVVTKVWNAIKSVTTSVWNAVKNAISGPINAANATVSRVVNMIKSAVTVAFNAAKAAATNAFNALKSAVSNIINNVYNNIRNVVNRIKGIFSGARNWLVQAGRNIIQGLINGIKAMVGRVADAIGSVTSKIRSFLPGSPIKEGPLKEHGWNSGEPGKKLMEFLAGGLADGVRLVNRAMRDIDPEVPIFEGQERSLINESAWRAAARAAAARADSRATAPTSAEASRVLNLEFNAYNPVEEKSSETAVREMTRLATLGVFN